MEGERKIWFRVAVFVFVLVVVCLCGVGGGDGGVWGGWEWGGVKVGWMEMGVKGLWCVCMWRGRDVEGVEVGGTYGAFVSSGESQG